MSVGGDLSAAAAALRRLPAGALTAAAPRIADAAEQVGARAAPRGIDGRRLGADTIVRHRGSGAVLQVAATPRGAWRIVNDGTRAHPEGDRAHILAGRGWRHPVRGPVAHPGARGRHVWPAVTDAAARVAADQLADDLDGVLAHAR